MINNKPVKSKQSLKFQKIKARKFFTNILKADTEDYELTPNDFEDFENIYLKQIYLDIYEDKYFFSKGIAKFWYDIFDEELLKDYYTGKNTQRKIYKKSEVEALFKRNPVFLALDRFFPLNHAKIVLNSSPEFSAEAIAEELAILKQLPEITLTKLDKTTKGLALLQELVNGNLFFGCASEFVKGKRRALTFSWTRYESDYTDILLQYINKQTKLFLEILEDGYFLSYSYLSNMKNVYDKFIFFNILKQPVSIVRDDKYAIWIKL